VVKQKEQGSQRLLSKNLVFKGKKVGEHTNTSHEFDDVLTFVAFSDTLTVDFNKGVPKFGLTQVVRLNHDFDCFHQRNSDSIVLLAVLKDSNNFAQEAVFAFVLALHTTQILE